MPFKATLHLEVKTVVKKIILLHKYRCWLVLTARKYSLYQGSSRAVINLLLNYIYTLSGPPRKARAKPSNHHEKKYLATARIEDIYKKRARVRKWW